MRKQIYLFSLLVVFVVISALITGCGGNEGKPTSIVYGPAPIVHYTFDSNAADVFGNYNGSLLGTAVIASNAKLGSGCLDLTTNVNEVVDSGHSYVEIPPITLPTSMTISFWVKPTGLPKLWVRVFDFADVTGNQNALYLNLYDGNGFMTFGSRITDSGRWLSPSEGVKTPLNEWSFVALTMSSAGAAIYVNGEQIATNTTDWNFAPSALGQLTTNYIGKSRWQDPAYKGFIDDFRIYNAVLLAAQIKALYQEKLVVK